MNKENIRNAKNFDELLDIKYGKIGTERRNHFEEKAQYFVISEMLKEARKEANMTQEQLAEIIGVSRQTINAIEKEKFDPSLPTAFKMAQLFDLPIEAFFLFNEVE